MDIISHQLASADLWDRAFDYISKSKPDGKKSGVTCDRCDGDIVYSHGETLTLGRGKSAMVWGKCKKCGKQHKLNITIFDVFDAIQQLSRSIEDIRPRGFRTRYPSEIYKKFKKMREDRGKSD